MIRFLQVNTAKNIPNVKAAAELKNGQPVAYNPAEGTVAAATGKCAYLVKAAETYNGMDAVRMPSDGAYEKIAAGAICHLVPAYVGEHYATTELTVGSLSAGDRVAADGGKFVANGSGEWIYVGEYADPTGLTMHEIIYSPIAE